MTTILNSLGAFALIFLTFLAGYWIVSNSLGENSSKIEDNEDQEPSTNTEQGRNCTVITPPSLDMIADKLFITRMISCMYSAEHREIIDKMIECFEKKHKSYMQLRVHLTDIRAKLQLKRIELQLQGIDIGEYELGIGDPKKPL